MLSIISGAALVGVGGTTFWWFAPRNGVVHPMVLKPFFDSSLTIAVMGVLAVGIALLVTGFVG
jgi:hypothetical protein